MSRRIAFVTCEELPGVDEDDAPLAGELAALGVEVVPVPWTDEGFAWERVDAALVRSTWDYHLRRDDFVEWAKAAASSTRLFNSADVLERNTHKRYLLDLAEAGFPVVPTVLLERGARADLARLLDERGWERAVVKPAVSIGSWRTDRVAAPVTAADQAFFDELLRDRDVLVQPFVASVETSGERCLVAIDGVPSHAVRKAPRFSRTDRMAPQVERVDMAEDEAAFARDVLAKAGCADLLYARVDLARDEGGRPVLMELELTEPRLYLRVGPKDAARDLARAIARRLD
jgi:hypothetical protein